MVASFSAELPLKVPDFVTAVPTGRSRPVITPAVVLLAVLTVPMSISGAAVALPDMGADLRAAGRRCRRRRRPGGWSTGVCRLGC